MRPSPDQIAMLCHEANRAICRAFGDDSQPQWSAAPEWQRHSAKCGVMEVLANPGITPEQLHAKWSEAKRADGWVYGPVKDAAAKTHPCLVEYHELPAEQRVKDYVFGAIVRAAMEIA